MGVVCARMCRRAMRRTRRPSRQKSKPRCWRSARQSKLSRCRVSSTQRCMVLCRTRACLLACLPKRAGSAWLLSPLKPRRSEATAVASVAKLSLLPPWAPPSFSSATPVRPVPLGRRQSLRGSRTRYCAARSIPCACSAWARSSTGGRSELKDASCPPRAPTPPTMLIVTAHGHRGCLRL